ncbi:MAG: chromosomal replication initiator protein DnaA [Clostridiales bacterium]|nr:chromosomal replication initiator protein DnaA [Clostridiales bacterium]
MQSYEIIWKTIAPEIEKVLSSFAYDKHIKGLKPIDLYDKTLVLMAKSQVNADFINLDTVRPKILVAMERAKVEVNDFEIFIGTNPDQYTSHKAENGDSKIESLPIDPNYTFDNFVVGNSNRYLYAAAKAVADDPGNNYNPLFIYGASGLGKTHIMHSIANHIHKHFPKKRVLYATCEKFMTDLIENIRSGKAYSQEGKNVRNKYRNVDVLIVDDVQFLSKKQSTQEEFFHTFNELYGANKQIVLSADCEPKEIELLDERLRTRFEGGLKAQVLPPDIETKIAIVQKKAELKKHIIGLDVATFIAENSDDNVRSLEGMLNKVLFSALLHEQQPNLALAMEALKDSAQVDVKETITTSMIIDTVCSYFKIKKSDLTGKKRNKELVEPRQICAYLMTELMSIPLVTIGQALGGKNYATIIHSRDKVSELIQISDSYATQVNDIKNLILKK